MRVSFNLFGLPASAYAPIAARADELGFDTVWLAEHLITPATFDSAYPYSSDGSPPYPVDTPMSDVWSVLAHVAASTSRIRLGTGVFILPLRHPVVTARAAATVQDLADGRLSLGIGAGWLRGEFEASGMSFDDRGPRMEEDVAVLRAVWGDQPASFSGAHRHLPPVHFAPTPCAPIPLLIGGVSAAARRRAAELGNGWYGPACSLAESVGARNDIEVRRRRVGRDREPFEYVVRLEGEPSPEALARYADEGFDHVVVGLGPDRSAEGVERLAARMWQ